MNKKIIAFGLSLICIGSLYAEERARNIPNLSQEEFNKMLVDSSVENKKHTEYINNIVEDTNLSKDYSLKGILSLLEKKHSEKDLNSKKYVYLENSPAKFTLSKKEYQELLETKNIKELVNALNGFITSSGISPYVYNVIREDEDTKFVLVGNDIETLNQKPYQFSNAEEAFNFLIVSDDDTIKKMSFDMEDDEVVTLLSKTYKSKTLSDNKKSILLSKVKEQFVDDEDMSKSLSVLPPKPTSKDIDLMLNAMVQPKSFNMDKVFTTYLYALKEHSLTIELKSTLDKKILDYVSQVNKTNQLVLDVNSIVASLVEPSSSDIQLLYNVYKDLKHNNEYRTESIRTTEYN